MILVDDEDDVRGRILSKINPNSGFDVVGKAGNGYDAIDLIEKYKPHVVLTDIKMPFIDGIELARIIRRDYPTTKVAFISGYDEFDYAREAIELNVVSYLMKPITSQDIDSFLKKLKKILDNEFDFLSDTGLIEKKYNESIPLLINSYLSTYRYKRELSKDDIAHLKQYQINLENNHYLIGIIGFDQIENIHESEETKVFIGNLLTKTFKRFDFLHSFFVPEGVIFLIKKDALKTARMIDADLYQIVKYAEEYRNTSLEIGISSVFEEFSQYPKAYRESEQALRHSKYFNIGQIIYYEDIKNKETKHALVSDSEVSEFEYVLKFGDKNLIKSHIDTLLDFGLNNKEGVIIDPQLFFIKLANALINYSSSINVDLTEIIQDDLIQSLRNLKDLNKLKSHIYDVVMKIRENNVEKQVNKTELIVQQVYQYIQNHYQDPAISLDSITNELNISVSYLSMLLKKMRGVTFNKELIKYRMEKAKELLKLTNEKILVISTMVGYNEVYYFSHSFKKYTGLSPN